jgi:hypothetical protein
LNKNKRKRVSGCGLGRLIRAPFFLGRVVFFREMWMKGARI